MEREQRSGRVDEPEEEMRQRGRREEIELSVSIQCACCLPLGVLLQHNEPSLFLCPAPALVLSLSSMLMTQCPRLLLLVSAF